MEENSVYTAPKSSLLQADCSRERKVSFLRKFTLSSLFNCIALLLIVVIFSSKEEWLQAGAGMLLITPFAGLISGFIPSKRKVIYIPLSFIVVVTILYFIGSSAA